MVVSKHLQLFPMGTDMNMMIDTGFGINPFHQLWEATRLQSWGCPMLCQMYGLSKHLVRFPAPKKLFFGWIIIFPKKKKRTFVGIQLIFLMVLWVDHHFP